MKFSKKINLLLLFILTIILLFTSTVSYADNTVVQPRTTDENLSIMPTEENSATTTNTSIVSRKNNSEKNAKNLYIQDNSVNIDYSVSGNVFILANDVTISGRVLGNVFILAQDVNITSKAYINSSLFVCADKVTIEGDIFDLYSASNKLSLSSNSRILRDITACGNSLDLYGAINRNAELTFDTINISADTTKIKGDLSYYSKELTIPEDIVDGEFLFNKIISESKFGHSAIDYLKDLLKVLIISIIIILIVILATPKFAEKEQKILENKAIASIGYGSISLVLIPIICFVLFCTVLGIMPALSILFAYLFLIIEVVSALVAIPLSKIICNKMNKNAKGMNVLISIILVILIWLLEQIPIVGNIVSLLIAILGLGILTYSIFHSKVQIKSKKVVAQASAVVGAKNSKKENKTEKTKSKKNLKK